MVLRLLGWFPDNETDELLMTLIFIKFVRGFFVVQALVTFASMLADIADEHALRTGKRQEGVFFAAASFSNKVAGGLGSAIPGFALTVISWPTSSSIDGAADVPAQTVMRLGLIYGPIVSGFALVCIYCFAQYRLDASRHRQIIVQLAEKRANATRQAI